MLISFQFINPLCFKKKMLAHSSLSAANELSLRNRSE